MAELLRRRQTKEAATDMFTLQPPRHIPTLPMLSKKSFWGTEQIFLEALMRWSENDVGDT
jgi:hypothetical protein